MSETRFLLIFKSTSRIFFLGKLSFCFVKLLRLLLKTLFHLISQIFISYLAQALKRYLTQSVSCGLCSFVDLPNLSSSIYTTELFSRLKAFLIACPPAGPTPPVVELVMATSDFQRDLALWNIRYWINTSLYMPCAIDLRLLLSTFLQSC